VLDCGGRDSRAGIPNGDGTRGEGAGCWYVRGAGSLAPCELPKYRVTSSGARGVALTVPGLLSRVAAPFAQPAIPNKKPDRSDDNSQASLSLGADPVAGPMRRAVPTTGTNSTRDRIGCSWRGVRPDH
jgi:hypothetical protein